MKKFDLNIEKVLEDWGIHHALRELIANAMDEQALTNTQDIEIFKDKNGLWHIRDYGRGLMYEHLTQNESSEKIKNPDKVIGKFGVGLKDAFATLDRKRIGIIIKSKHSDISLGKSSKSGFEDVVTLHALVREPSEPKMVGTDIILKGITEKHIDLAKDFFLKFSGETILENTSYGSVLAKNKLARIYVSGLKVAEEENFLFSYNITSITKKIKKSLNRERTNVGRSAYTERVKSILLESKSSEVATLLIKDLEKYELGKLHDELNWIDVAVHACRLLNAKEKVIFLTPIELSQARSMVDYATHDGYKIIVIPQNVKEKIRGLKDIAGNEMQDLENYTLEWNDSFEYAFINPKDLSSKEKEIFDKTKQIFKLIGGKPSNIKKILISETMQLQRGGNYEAQGLWDPIEKRIIIKRSQLKNFSEYAGTLLHEVAHAISGADDISLEFETELTHLLGVVANNK